MLTKGFFTRKYNSIVILSLLGWLIDVVATASDTIFSGLFISEEAIAATGLVTPIGSLILFASSMIGGGVSNKYSNYMGNYNKDDAEKTVFVGVSSSIVVGVVFALMMYLFQNAYFNFYDVGEAIEPLARQYYQIFIFYAAIFPVYLTIYSLVYVDGNVKLIFGVDTFSAIGNVILSLILVRIMGIKGLALGTLLALIISCLQLIPHFFSNRNSIRIKFKYNFKLLKEIIESGSIISLSALYSGIFDILMNKYIITSFGTQFLAAYAIISLILDISSTLSSASDGSLAFVGISYGENNTLVLKKAFKKAIQTAVIICIFYAVVFMTFANKVPLIYGIENSQIYEVSMYVLKVLPLFLAFKGIIVIYAYMFGLIEMSIIGNIINFLNSLALPLILSMVFGHFFNFYGIAWGIGVAWLLNCINLMLLILLIKGKEYLPFGVKDSSNPIFNYEYKVCDEEILNLQNIIKNDLETYGINKSVINKILLTLEETLEIVKEKNKKDVLGDCSIIINKDTISLTTRDNGVIFDIVEESDDLKSLRNYVVNSLVQDAMDAKYLTTNSFNRNNFIWNI